MRILGQWIKLRRMLLIVSIFFLISIVSSAQSDQLNKDNFVAFLESAYNTGDVSAIDTLFADDFVYHPGGLNKNDLLVNILGLRAALPDIQATPLIAISDANWVAVHMNIEGTFTSDLIIPNSVPFPPTNTPIQFVLNIASHFNAEGQIIEQWVTFDNLNYLAQLQIINTEPIAWAGPTELVNLIARDSIDIQENTIMRYLDALNRRDTVTLSEVIDESFVGYNPFGTIDKTSQINDLTSLLDAFPDLQITVTQVITEGNVSVALYNMRGTFTQNFVLGENNAFPANNNALDLIRIDFFQLTENNTINESREIYDSLDFMAQLGILPIEMQQP